MVSRGFLAAAMLAVLIAGCGGDDERASNPASGEAVSRQELISEADGACRDYEESLLGIREAIVSAKTKQEIAEASEQLADEAASRAERIAELEPPAELAAEWDRFLMTTDEQAKLLDLSATASAANDGAGVDYYNEKLGQVGQHQSQIAKDLGLKVCGQ